MKILHVTECLASGTAAAIFAYVRAMPGAEHHIVYARRPESTSLETGWEERFASHQEFPEGTLNRIRHTRARIREIAPDWVYSHSSWGGLYARAAAFGTSAARGRVRHAYTPHCFAFERRDVPAGVRIAIRAMEAVLALNTHAFAACSPGEARLARALPGRAQVIHVPNVGGQEARAAIPAKMHDGVASKQGAILRLVGAGRVNAQKDPEYFARAAAVLRGAGVALEATWIGDGDADRVAELESHGVRVTGWLNGEEYRQILSESDVYLHSARWEGFPITVLEAADAGLPVIVRRISAFESSGLASIDEPEDIAAHREDIVSAEGRARLRTLTERALESHTPEAQQRALAEIFGVESIDGAGAGSVDAAGALGAAGAAGALGAVRDSAPDRGEVLR